MTQSVRMLLCAVTGIALCQCSFFKDKEKTAKKKDTSSMPLAQRSMLKPDENQRSQFEKFITNPKSKGNSGSYYQKQMHHSKSFNGGDSYAGQKQFKTDQSWFGKSKASGTDMTYSLGGKSAKGMDGTFKTDSSRLGSQKAREATSTFSGADNMFKTSNALTRSERVGKAPNIIENYNDMGGKKSAYSEDEVKKLLNRN
ncbi:MAG: hypothetical protein U1F71_16895 [Verrucomicrobiaceae bacterium]